MTVPSPTTFRDIGAEDVPCPLAIAAMAIAQGTTGRKVKIGLSDFSDDGSKTLISFL